VAIDSFRFDGDGDGDARRVRARDAVDASSWTTRVAPARARWTRRVVVVDDRDEDDG
jgi:hypothetical protein